MGEMRADPENRIEGDGMDRLLRRSMAGAAPKLSADFEQRVLRRARRSSQPLEHRERVLLIGYAVMSVVVCAVVMRGQGLDWASVAGMTGAPLVLLAAARAAMKMRPSIRRG